MIDIAIYALVDPRDNEIRYIGQTANIKARYSNFSPNTASGRSVSFWFDELNQIGLVPEIRILEMVSFDKAGEREMQWIQSARESGVPLLNTLSAVRSRRSPPEKMISLNAKVPESLFRELKDLAEKDRRSVSGFVVYWLMQFVDQHNH